MQLIFKVLILVFLLITISNAAILTNADLDGTYLVTGRGSVVSVFPDPDGDGPVTETMLNTSDMWAATVTFDGVGGCAYSESLNKDAVINISESGAGAISISANTPVSDTCTYDLDGNGKLTLGNGTFSVSQDTNIISGVSIEKNGDVVYVDSMTMIKQSGAEEANIINPSVVMYLLN